MVGSIKNKRKTLTCQSRLCLPNLSIFHGTIKIHISKWNFLIVKILATDSSKTHAHTMQINPMCVNQSITEGQIRSTAHQICSLGIESPSSPTLRKQETTTWAIRVTCGQKYKHRVEFSKLNKVRRSTGILEVKEARAQKPGSSVGKDSGSRNPNHRDGSLSQGMFCPGELFFVAVNWSW